MPEQTTNALPPAVDRQTWQTWQTRQAAPSRSGHLPINGLSLYHEVYGEIGGSTTSPLLLVPGAFMATGSMSAWVSAFARDRPVIVFDQQGHGRTPDTPRAMSYEQFADDAAALLRTLSTVPPSRRRSGSTHPTPRRSRSTSRR